MDFFLLNWGKFWYIFYEMFVNQINVDVEM